MNLNFRGRHGHVWKFLLVMVFDEVEEYLTRVKDRLASSVGLGENKEPDAADHESMLQVSSFLFKRCFAKFSAGTPGQRTQ